jgi:hypothetical protein
VEIVTVRVKASAGVKKPAIRRESVEGGTVIVLDETPPRLQTELTLDSGTFRSKWVDFQTNHFTARMSHTSASLMPLEADWQWSVVTPESRWGNARLFELAGRLTRSPTNAPSIANADWAWWSLLEPYVVDWSARLGGVTLNDLVVDEVGFDGIIHVERWNRLSIGDVAPLPDGPSAGRQPRLDCILGRAATGRCRHHGRDGFLDTVAES